MFFVYDLATDDLAEFDRVVEETLVRFTAAIEIWILVFTTFNKPDWTQESS